MMERIPVDKAPQVFFVDCRSGTLVYIILSIINKNGLIHRFAIAFQDQVPYSNPCPYAGALTGHP